MSMAQELTKLLEVIVATARTGMAFSPHPYDLRRYQTILEVLEKIFVLLTGDDENLSVLLSSLHLAPIEVGNKEYVTPKVAVVAVVFNQRGEVLLVKRNEGFWALPGGYADVSLDPIENAEKEVKEETGIDVKVESLIGIYDSNISEFPTIGRQVYALVFYAMLIGGNIIPDPIETNGASFFSLNDLPPLFPATLDQIGRARRSWNGEKVEPMIDHVRI